MSFFYVGPWIVEAALNRVSNNGTSVRLEPKIMQVLVRLAETPGEVVGKEELISTVWAGTFVSDDVLTRCISELRKVFEDDARQPRYIETIPRRGYRLVAPVAPHGPKSSADIAGPAIAVSRALGPVRIPASRSRIIWVTAGGLAIAVAASAWWQRLSPPQVRNYKQITHDGARKGNGLAVDSSRVYFMGKTPAGYAIQHMSIEGGEPVMLRTALGADLNLLDVAANGTEALALPSSDDSQEWPLYAVSLPAGTPRPIGNIVALDAAWSPDGRIVYSHDNTLYFADREGAHRQKLVRVPRAPFHPRVSPDGRLVRFTMVKAEPIGSDLWELGADGTNLHTLLPDWNMPVGGGHGNWSRDGRYYFFQAYVHGAMGVWALPRSSVFERHPKPTLLTPGLANVTAPVPSRDGMKLFALVGVTRTEVIRYDEAARKFVPFLPLSGTAFNFTRDGHVIYTQVPGFDLVRSKLDGSEQIVLNSALRPRISRLSPDDKLLAFTGASDHVGVYLLPSAGGEPSEILRGNYAVNDWSPDGAFLVCYDRTATKLVMVGLKDGSVTTVVGSDGLDAARWSPDGMHLAARRMRDAAIMLFDFNSQSWHEAAAGRSDYPFWSPDGHYLYFLSVQGTANAPTSETTLYRIAMKTAKQEMVTSLRDIRRDDVDSFISWAGVGPGGSLVTLRDNTTVDVYSLDWNPR